MSEFDLAVIGSGPGGYRAAVLATLRGLKVAIIEKAQWGGCCLNRGCVPKKDWHHSAKLIAASRDFAQRGISGTLTPDFAAAWQHQKRIVVTVRDSYVDYMKRLGIAAFEGHARLSGPHSITVGGHTLGARNIMIATGSSPFVPPNFATSERILTSDDLFDRQPPPGRRIAIIGGGVIATEFAFILAMLGHHIEWFASGKPLARSRFSAPALKLLEQTLARFDLKPQAKRPIALHTHPDRVELEFSDGARTEVDWTLLATGRKPHTIDLGLEALGVNLDHNGFIQTNAHLETSSPHIYAIGDVANPGMTANYALADASLAVENILTPRSVERDNAAVPEVIYSAIELARIGGTEDEAEDAGFEPAVGFAAFETNPRALGQDAHDGFVRLIADLDSGHLLGGEIVGEEAGELIHGLARKVGKDKALFELAHTFYNHPARSEELLNASETLAAKWGLMRQIFTE